MYTTERTEAHHEALRETIIERRHESGMPVYLCPKPGFRKQYACYATRFGSVDASFRVAGGGRLDVPDGVAHFLEHKVFAGEEGDAFERFSELGASPNAYTTFGLTNYLFSSGKNFFECLDHLLRFVNEPYFTDENVSKEQGIIAQEIQMYEDHPGYATFFSLLESLYHAHPIRKQIAGSVSSISEIDKGVLYDCYNTFYHPENMILFAIGDIDEDEYFSRVDAVLTEKRRPPLGEVERFYPDEPEGVARKEFVREMEVSMPRVLIGFKDRQVGFGGRELLEKELVTDLLLEVIFGQSSEFFQRLYDDGLIDDDFGASYTGVVDAGHSLVGGQTRDPNRLTEVVVEEVKRVRETGVSEEDFERQKRATTGSLLNSFNTLEFIARNFCSYYFSAADLFDIIPVLREMRRDDLNARLREHLDPDSMARSVVMPKGLAS